MTRSASSTSSRNTKLPLSSTCWRTHILKRNAQELSKALQIWPKFYWGSGSGGRSRYGGRSSSGQFVLDQHAGACHAPSCPPKDAATITPTQFPSQTPPHPHHAILHRSQTICPTQYSGGGQTMHANYGVISALYCLQAKGQWGA